MAMRILKLFLVVCAMCSAAPARAGDEARSVNAGPPADQNRSGRAERPQRKAVKLSPAVHVSRPHPDESGDMRRIAPLPADAPLQNIPALKDVTPPGGASAGGR
jgi:hypothetical protein